MTVESTQRAMTRYFEALGRDELEVAVSPDVSWTILDTGKVIRGAREVAQHLHALHGSMQDTGTRELIVGDGVAVLEGDASVLAEPARIAFCVVYDVREDRVAAMRLYGPIEAVLTRSL